MTKYDVFRRRIAPIAFGLAIAFLAYRSCQNPENITATFIIDYGSAEGEVRAVQADIWMDGEPVGHFRRQAIEGGLIGTSKFTATLPGTDGELRMDIELRNGEHRMISRRIHVEDGSTVTIQLERDLR